MCEPATIMTAISLGIAAGGAGASIAGQSQANSAAKQVEKQKQTAVEKQIEENRRRATADYIASVQDEQTQQDQEQQALTEQELDIAKKGRDASSQARVAAGESGVSGQSLAVIEADYAMQMEVAAGRLGISQQWRDAQHERNIQAQGRVYENRVSQVQPYQQQPVRPVDYFSPIFGVFGTATDMAVRTGMVEGAMRKNPLAST
jgi:hypothetical protein